MQQQQKTHDASISYMHVPLIWLNITFFFNKPGNSSRQIFETQY